MELLKTEAQVAEMKTILQYGIMIITHYKTKGH
jgi:hypothetical protein